MISRRVFLLTPLALAAQSPELAEGYRLLYHLRFADARQFFVNWQQTHPADPLGFASEAAAHLFEEFEHHGVLTTEFFLDDDRLLGGITGTADAARTRAFEKAVERAHLIGKGGRDANALLALTLAAGMRADYAALITKRQIESLRQIREAEGFGSKLLLIAPHVTDGYVALGAANYILACLPSYKRALLWFGGMQGNKARGMQQLGRAAQDGLYLAPYAKVLLALASLREKRGADAARLMKELTTAFPTSPIFARERAKIERMGE
jgi:hypothetical protein